MKHEKVNGETHIYVENGEQEEDVLRAIVKASFQLARPAGLSRMNFAKEQEMTDADADRFIFKPFASNATVVKMDYVGGRQCKTYLSKVEDGHFTLFNYFYERDRGLPDQMLELAKKILDGKKEKASASSSEMYKGESLTLLLKSRGYNRLPGESDWEFRQRTFPDFYLKDPDRAMEVLMGASSTEWGEFEKFLFLAFTAEGTRNPGRLEWFARGFADDPIIMREKHLSA